MNLMWLLIASQLLLMVQSNALINTATLSASNSTYLQAPDPCVPPEDYRRAVASSIQDLVSGRRPRDQALRGMSTTRLIIEGVVENLRIFRLHRQEMERKARAKEEKGRERRRTGRHQNSQREDGERHRHSNRRHRKRQGEKTELDHGERRRRRRHHTDDEEHGHRRRRKHRSADGMREQRGRQRHRSRSAKGYGKRDVEGQTQQETRGKQQASSKPTAEPFPSNSDFTMSGALPVVEALRGPDGTSFGSIPIRGAGVGFFSHAQSVYKHFKAEQDAGYRSKGLVERHIDTFIQKRRDASGAQKGGEEKLSIETRRGRRRGRRDREGVQEAERQSRRSEVPVFVPVDGVDRPSAERRGSRQSASSGEQTMPSGQEARPLVQQSNNNAYDDRVDHLESALEREKQEARNSTGAFGRPLSTSIASPATAPSVRSARAIIPPVRSRSPSRGGPLSRDGSVRAASCAPSIQVQSPTPPEELRSPTPFAHEDSSRHQSPEPELDSSVAPGDVWIPGSSVHDSSRFPAPPPLAPPPPPPVVSAPAGSNRDAFVASIQTGTKLKKVRNEDLGGIRAETPTYKETPHSHNVEALEHAQSVEERELKQEEERAAHSKTPLTATQPRMKMPMSFQDELAAKVGKMRLDHQSDDNEGSGVKPCASNVSWGTVFNEHEEENRMPDRQFREMLGDTLSRRRTAAAQSRAETPTPDVFVNLSANMAGPGWQSEPSWDFGSVPVDDNDEARGDGV